MIKAYLYPLFYGGVYNNSVFDGANACRVECFLPAVPSDGQTIVFDAGKFGLAESLYQNCLKQLNNSESRIAQLLVELRRFLQGEKVDELYGYSNLIDNGYSNLIDKSLFANPCTLTDEELLHKLILEKDQVYGFSDDMWIVFNVDMLANDDHLHIMIEHAD